MNTELPYFNESGVNALLLLQKKVFQAQVNHLQQIVENKKNESIEIKGDLKIPSIFSRRTLADEYRENGRLVDNEELTLLAMLDSSGKLSCEARLIEFIVLMTRLSKVEHRLLCLHVLLKHTSEACDKAFVVNGGLRIVKRWIVSAQAVDGVEELKALVKLCKKLPFVTQAVKVTEIGKTIKKLLKYKPAAGAGSAASSIDTLHDSVKALMTHWMEQANLAAASGREVQVKGAAEEALPELVGAISDRMLRTQGLPVVATTKETESVAIDVLESKIVGDADVQEVEAFHQQAEVEQLEPHDLEEESCAMEVEEHQAHHEQQVLPSVVKTEQLDSVMDVVAEPETVTPVAVQAEKPVPFKLNIVRVPDTTSATPTPLTTQQAPTFATPAQLLGAGSVKSAGSLAGVARQARKSTDMAEGARKLLAMRASAQTESGKGVSADSAKQTQAALQPDPATRRGGLKKSGDSGAKKAKLSIVWADEKGGQLREVHTIEVEKIKSSTASYKSHRDLVKKERQLEKDTHLSKVQDAMHKNTEWRTPLPLKLSVEVLENSDNPVVSEEKDAQTRRLAHVLEVRYLEDSLIPPDPDESLAAADDFPTAPAVTIPWYLPGTEPVHSSNGPEPSKGDAFRQSQMQPPSSSSGGRGFDPMQQQGDSSSDYNSIVAALPLSLQRLEPSVLLQIVQDQSLLLSLLNADGTVDENRVALLQLQLSSSGNRPQNAFNSSFPDNSLGRGLSSGQSVRQGFSSGGAGNGEGRPLRSRWGEPSSVGLMPSTMGLGGGFPPGDSFANVGGVGAGRESRFGSRLATPISSLSSSSGWGGDNTLGFGLQQRPNDMLSDDLAFPSSSYGGGGAPLQSSKGNVDRRGIKWTSTKAATACRFFNTSKGCQFGDKCQFGHFGAVDSAPLQVEDSFDSGLTMEMGSVGNKGTRWGPAGNNNAGVNMRRGNGPGGPGFMNRNNNLDSFEDGPGHRGVGRR